MHIVAETAQATLQGVDDPRVATGPETVAEHEIDSALFSARVEGGIAREDRRHGMAVDQQGRAEPPSRAGDQRLQGGVIGLVESLDAPQSLGRLEFARINLVRVGDDPAGSSESRRDAERSRVGEIWKRVLEHARIEFVGLAVQIEIGARKSGAQHRRADGLGAAEQ